MIKKSCTRCKRASYSSTNLGSWICPYCGVDLTEERILKVTQDIDLLTIKNRIDYSRGIQIYKSQVR